MVTKYIQSLSTFGEFAEITADQQKALKGNYPRMVSRRMSNMALMIGDCLQDVIIDKADLLIYATTYSEVLSLERYLASFPTPSPLYFQNSIHPSGIEQILIANQQPVITHLPLAGRDNIMHSALMAALSDGGKTWLVGAEESGTWLTEKQCAGDVNFAFCVEITSEAGHALAQISWDKEEAPENDNNQLSTYAFFRAIKDRKPIQVGNSAMGTLRLEW